MQAKGASATAYRRSLEAVLSRQLRAGVTVATPIARPFTKAPRTSSSRYDDRRRRWPPKVGHQLTASATDPSASHRLVRLQLTGGDDAPRRARTALRSPLDWQVTATAASDAELVVSELVTNSVRHANVRAHEALILELLTLDDRLRIVVSDPGLEAQAAERRPPTPEPPGGVRVVPRSGFVRFMGSRERRRRTDSGLVRAPVRPQPGRRLTPARRRPPPSRRSCRRCRVCRNRHEVPRQLGAFERPFGPSSRDGALADGLPVRASPSWSSCHAASSSSFDGALNS